MVNLDLAASSALAPARRGPILDRLSGIAWRKAAFLLVWEGQGHLASFTYVGLVAFADIWLALGAMFAWSVLATCLFFAARERGYPNLLSETRRPEQCSGRMAWYALGALGRACSVGLNAFAFSRCVRFMIVDKEDCCRFRRLARAGVLGLGLTLFGVTSAEHLLRTAGYRGRKLLQMSLIGPFLHVPYRVLVSAAAVAVFTDAMSRLAIV